MSIKPNKDILLWALERAGLSVNDASNRWCKFEGWLDGSWSPTVNQIREFAAFVHINVSSLFAQDIPDLGLQIADFRTVDDTRSNTPSPELFDTVNQMMRRQIWMRDYFLTENYPQIQIVGSYSDFPMNQQTAEELASYLHNSLHIAEDWAFRLSTVTDALKCLKTIIEAAGISVVVNGIVDDNTHRPLKVEEFRGFVLSDKIAPLIFINGKDAKTAQIFTLIHELAHLAYSQTGVSNPSDEVDGNDSVQEKFCNRVAADFLVPTAIFKEDWNSSYKTTYKTAETLAKKYKVNFVVIARKAKDVNLINEQTFFAIYNEYKRGVPLNTTNNPSSGGDYFLTKQYRLGSIFSEAVWTAVNTGYIDYRTAYDLTGLKSDSFDKYFKGSRI